MKKRLFLPACLLGLVAAGCLAADFHDWAPVPPKGWNSWDCFGPSVTEAEVKANADYMAEHLKQHGWEYIVVDIRWYVINETSGLYNQAPQYSMDKYGRFTPAVNRFPSAANGAGFKPLADYCHKKGLKFGIHIMRGIPMQAVEENTPILGTNLRARAIYHTDSLCSWLRQMYSVDATKKGAQEYYNSLFKLYADWGVDFVKVDDIARPYHTGEIELIRKAIDQCGRPIVLSLSPGAAPLDKAAHLRAHANMWRTTDDFWDVWTDLKHQFEVCARWAPYISYGSYPDADMLPLGKFIRGERATNRTTRFTPDEQTLLMTLWTIFRSPLIFGGNLPDNDAFTNQLLTNRDVLHMHAYSTHNRQLERRGDLVVWTADDTKSTDKYLALFNLNDPKTWIWASDTINRNRKKQYFDVSVSGATDLYLVVDALGHYSADHADWIKPMLYTASGDSICLTELTWESATAGWGSVRKNSQCEGNNLIVDGITYSEGIGTHAHSVIHYRIAGYERFKGMVGLDYEGEKQASNRPAVQFRLYTVNPSLPGQDTLSVNLAALGLTTAVSVTDMWQGTSLGNIQGTLTRSVPTHGCVLYRLSPK
jgi:hypothetical protein